MKMIHIEMCDSRMFCGEWPVDMKCCEATPLVGTGCCAEHDA